MASTTLNVLVASVIWYLSSTLLLVATIHIGFPQLIEDVFKTIGLPGSAFGVTYFVVPMAISVLIVSVVASILGIIPIERFRFNVIQVVLAWLCWLWVTILVCLVIEFLPCLSSRVENLQNWAYSENMSEKIVDILGFSTITGPASFMGAILYSIIRKKRGEEKTAM